jgi:hypothetical protein
MFAKLRVLTVALGTITLLAPLASADGFGVSFSKKGGHASIGFEFTSGTLCEPAPPPPVAVCTPSVWVPAHYETVLQDVWIEGQQERVWCGPVFEWRLDACGKAHKVLVAQGHWNMITTPGHHETRRVQVWQPGHWQITGPHSW